MTSTTETSSSGDAVEAYRASMEETYGSDVAAAAAENYEAFRERKLRQYGRKPLWPEWPDWSGRD